MPVNIYHFVLLNSIELQIVDLRNNSIGNGKLCIQETVKQVDI